MKRITSIIVLLVSFFVFSQQKSSLYSTKNKSVTVYTTAESSSLRLSKTDNLTFSELKQPTERQICVFVNPDKTFQSFLGIGGAITDATAEVFAKLSNEKQQEFLNAYYNKESGIGYTLMRTTIHSSDFSSTSYTYIDEGDTALKTFSIEHDRKYRIPLLKKAIAAAGGKITLFASPWSPPAFMKSNNDILKGGTLLPDYFQPWATYYTKFVKAYEKEGIPIWGISLENEPMAVQKWESCVYTAEAERDFLKNYLGPTMKKEGLGDKNIIVWDHNRDLMLQRANVIFSDPEAAKYAWGMGFHWYETWAGGNQMFENVGKVHAAYPNKNLLFTEGCIEKFDAKNYQLWANGERYGSSMIHDFNNGTVGWTDWNILLDENGGPNHAGNFCFAPIHADSKTGELIYTPSYYYIGHFSKFIRPEAKRVSTAVSRSSLLSTSFLNKDGKMITVVMNESDATVIYNLCVGTQATQITILPNAIQTLVY
ncbi:glycosyl hydrolase [Flavobacterium sp. ZT3R18]|uniref:glycoside hydrolase family 30 protein n=1 Tax=Flavobacterium sp. ZT3R18 TaxID=2594429 RepID=UPI00117B758D|nr:glycoside hydrolase family 30 protein [Flavobacterium sp. ZT3R18]TRX35580.1 glycosyl hydrolase [Flavobacterium sp. ZT3R18]